MNSVILTGYIKTKNELRTSKKGNKFLKNVLMVGNDKNNSIDHIPFMAFGEQAIAIDKAGAGVTIEIRGKIKSDYNKETKVADIFVVVDDVQLTDNIQDEEAFIDNPMDDIDMTEVGDDDLPF